MNKIYTGNPIKVLVTGGTGFLGKHLQKAFEPYHDQYHIYYIGSEFDLTNRYVTSRMFEIYRPDIVIHMAAVCGGIKANQNRPADFIHDNTMMALNVVDSCREFSVQKLYALGSVCMYPKYCPVPFREDDIWNGSAETTNFPYGQAKRTLMMLQQTYRDQYGLRGAHFIPVNMFGPCDNFDLETSHVIPALINKFVTAVKNNTPIVKCWGTGEATREFLYVEDAAQVIVKAVIFNLDTCLPINIGTGKDISIKDLAYMIAELTGFKGSIEFTGEVSDGQPIRKLDISRAKELLGFTASTSLIEGLVKTITWYRKGTNEFR